MVVTDVITRQRALAPSLPFIIVAGLLFQSQGVVEYLGLPTAPYRAASLVGAAVLAWLYRGDSPSSRFVLAMWAALAALLLPWLGNGIETGMTAFRDAYAILVLLAFIGLGRHLSERGLVIALAVFGGLFLAISFVKLPLHGVDESEWIGTLSMTAGQYGITYAALFMPLVLPLHLIWGIVAAVPFGLAAIVHEKRMVLAVYPAIVFGALFMRLMLRPVDWKLAAALTAVAATSCLVVALLAVRMIPSLNPEEKVWGSISVPHVVDYVPLYSMREYESPLNNPVENIEVDAGIQIGRLAMFPQVAQWSAGRPLLNQIIGDGAGVVDASPVIGAERKDVFFAHTGIRGPTTMLMHLLVERGWLGVAAFFGPLLALLLWHLRHLIRERDARFSRWAAFWTLGIVTTDLALYSAVPILVPAAMVIVGLCCGRADERS